MLCNWIKMPSGKTVMKYLALRHMVCTRSSSKEHGICSLYLLHRVLLVRLSNMQLCHLVQD